MINDRMTDYAKITYEIEDKFLSRFACKSKDSKGRERAIAPCPLRTEFARDRDRIIHCKAFRRLKHKTQVFLAPEGDHYRTRLTHTLEVAQIARTIARALRLNEDLTEAIALGHDLGHTPFGHAGERALGAYTKFLHNEQSRRVVDVLEYDFVGMNLTFEVRDGILNHTSKGNPATLEGQIVQWSDRVAYINHDIDDAIRGGVLSADDVPKMYRDAFGETHGRRINAMVIDIVGNSINKNKVAPSKKCEELISGLRKFMFDTVYTGSNAKAEEGKAIEMVGALYKYYKDNPDKLPEGILGLNCNIEQKVCDYISTMSDSYAIWEYNRLFVPKGWGLR